MISSPRNWRLYYLLQPSADARFSLLELAEQALVGGAGAVQLRLKEEAEDEVLAAAVAVREICRRHGAAFVVNDAPELAARAGADGVHVGASDPSPAEARRLLGSGAVIGASAQDVEEALRAEGEGADYLGVGPVYDSPTKGSTALGLEALDRICRAVKIPVLGIGGITAGRAAKVIAAGACGVAVVSAIGSAPDPCGAARVLRGVVDLALQPRG